MNTFQQGDVIGRKVQSLPLGTPKVISKKKLVLAEGEVTGHYHGIESSNSQLLEIDNRVFMVLEEPAVLTHQEHNHITVEPGVWEIGKVQEYDYFSKMVRPVQD
jgi:hypothetical protein